MVKKIHSAILRATGVRRVGYCGFDCFWYYYSQF